jgi:hypothetical protein
MREPVRRNLGPRTLVFKFEDLSAAEAHIYASELRDMLPASVPGATLDHIPDTPFPQASDTTVALRIERQSLAALKKALETWFHHHPGVALTIEDSYLGYWSVFAPPRGGMRYRCPCCHYKTLEERGGYDICPVCFWEDDGQDDQEADMVRVITPNHMSLTQGRANYRRFGASQERLIPHVRPPLPEEL